MIGLSVCDVAVCLHGYSSCSKWSCVLTSCLTAPCVWVSLAGTNCPVCVLFWDQRPPLPLVGHCRVVSLIGLSLFAVSWLYLACLFVGFVLVLLSCFLACLFACLCFFWSASSLLLATFLFALFLLAVFWSAPFHFSTCFLVGTNFYSIFFWSAPFLLFSGATPFFLFSGATPFYLLGATPFLSLFSGATPFYFTYLFFWSAPIFHLLSSFAASSFESYFPSFRVCCSRLFYLFMDPFVLFSLQVKI